VSLFLVSPTQPLFCTFMDSSRFGFPECYPSLPPKMIPPVVVVETSKGASIYFSGPERPTPRIVVTKAFEFSFPTEINDTRFSPYFFR